MPCEKCGERKAFYCDDADYTLCQLCYETWADDHAQEIEAEALHHREDALYLQHKLAVAFETPLAREHYILWPVNGPLTSRH